MDKVLLAGARVARAREETIWVGDQCASVALHMCEGCKWKGMREERQG